MDMILLHFSKALDIISHPIILEKFRILRVGGKIMVRCHHFVCLYSMC